MKQNSSKLQQGQKEETVQAGTTQQNQNVTAHEFAIAEEMLRADAAQTEVPPAVKTRLAESVRKESPPEKPRSWWKRLIN